MYHYYNTNKYNQQYKPHLTLHDIITLWANKTNYIPRLYGKGYKGLCPVHNDTRPSLTAYRGYDGGLVFHCFAECPHRDVCSALNLSPKSIKRLKWERNLWS